LIHLCRHTCSTRPLNFGFRNAATARVAKDSSTLASVVESASVLRHKLDRSGPRHRGLVQLEEEEEVVEEAEEEAMVAQDVRAVEEAKLLADSFNPRKDVGLEISVGLRTSNKEQKTDRTRQE
jgi:hypothetical protein